MRTTTAIGCLLASALMVLQFSALPLPVEGQLSTTDHLEEAGFWPTTTNTARGDYVGPAACAACHRSKAAEATPMARTLAHAGDAQALHTHPDLRFSVADYRYRIKTAGSRAVYTVKDGKSTQSVDLLWAFGTPRIGQSYLFKMEDKNAKMGDEQFYEARVTYFAHLQNLEFTPTRALSSPKDLAEAMYRKVDAGEVGRCFGCHSTASTVDGHFDEKNLIPGVSCEACHGPGVRHVAAMQATMQGMTTDSAPRKTSHAVAARGTDIYNAAYLSPSDSVDFCGACHGTWWDVKLSAVKGVSTARSAPYRLETSKCWGRGDARITCIACHDPHQQLQTDSSAYDHACLKCHAAAIGAVSKADHPGKACKVRTSNCTSCHMQKVYVPEMHDVFTDHRIRVARDGEPFPE